MFSKKPPENSKQPDRRRGADLMNQLGLGPILGSPEMGFEGGDDDGDDLEAELAALAGEDYTPPSKPKAKRKAPMAMADIEKLASAGVADVDENVSDTEDPDLLAELNDLKDSDDEPPARSPLKSPSRGSSTAASPIYQPIVQTQPSPAPRSLPSPQKSPAPTPSPRPAASPKTNYAPGMVGVLQERLDMYKEASANAKAAGESSKQRRMDRGMKNLMGLLKQAKAGKPVNEEEIPPPVAVGTQSGAATDSSASRPAQSAPSNIPSPSQTAPTVVSNDSSHPPAGATAEASVNDPRKQALIQRRDQYKKAAFMAKRNGDMTKASRHVKTILQFEAVMQALDEGKPVDLSQMPGPPPEFSGAIESTSKPLPSVQQSTQNIASPDELAETTTEEEKSLFNAPDAPKTVLEALMQRLNKYKGAEASAKSAGEGSKARRMGRIVKQYEDTIKSYKAGKPVDFDELPTPPGFAPIPKEQPKAAVQSPPKPAPAPRPAPQAPAVQAPGPSQPHTTTGQKHPIQRQNTGRRSLSSRAEQQLAFVKERMEEFRQAAIKAKSKHDIELAKKYARMMKGLQPMVDALESGLPVDLNQVPPSPFGVDDPEDKFIVVAAEDCQPTGDREEVFDTLKQDLVRQIRMCVTNAQHYQKLGDVPAAAKFQKLENNSRKDLESLKSAYQHGDPSPKFHYETRTFSMVQCNTDLGDADLEVSIIRGIQYNLPSGYSEKDMDTSVKYEFGYPTDEPQSGGTGTVKDTTNPEYNETFKVQINRKSRGLFRFIERKGLKFEVFIKRGFFKGDKLLGTVNMKFNDLETKCTLHDSYDLMDGRKTVGGKLEVKIRIRDPLKARQVEEVREKWLVIDQFIRTPGSKSQADAKSPKNYNQGTLSMSVLRYEKQLLDKQIEQLKGTLSLTQAEALKRKSYLIEEKIELQQKKLREGDINTWKEYLAIVERESYSFEQEARQYVKLGEVQKAELMLTKKKYATQEMAAVKAKIPNL